MNSDQVEAIFERMYLTCGVGNDYQLAKYLGVKASSVKGWKIAKHPPFKACYEIFIRTGVTMEWLVTGQTPEEYHKLNPLADCVAESEGVYHVTAESAEPTQVSLNQDKIRMPLDEFQALFREAIIDGISSQFFELLPGTDRRAINALAARYYRKVNDPVVLPDAPESSAEGSPETRIA